ncbi:MAG: hypothetical protein HY801_03440, partial [Candidatus Lindowbacteria bacterium]|nr:hypothetical protein [Candidatus Lindowbacteria bacterium]
MNRSNVILAALLAVICGCGTTRNQNLHAVAKDWCMVIRASQVIPVYPLTEDVQVGDIFLVQQTVDDQHHEYEESGFLPMENLVDRLAPTGYPNFYSHSFASADGLDLPKDWLDAGGDACWKKAPGANFPAYSFSVKSGVGLNMGLPLQGVPIGLSLLGADAGEGTISIQEAKTYGIDAVSLHKNILDWERDHHEFLLNYASREGKTNYLRIVSRVYLAKKMNVSIRASKTREGGLSAGVPKPVELLALRTATDIYDTKSATAENYKKSLDALNKSIADALGTVQE